MASEVVHRYAKKFLGDDLRLGFIGLWVAEGEYDSTWHRDTSGVLGTNHREDCDEEREFAILQASRGAFGDPRVVPDDWAGDGEYLGKSFKWQTALIDEGDPCLFVCPGSHRRYRTPEERQALCFDWETDGKSSPIKPLPTEVQLKLKRGQTAVWAGSTIHRGRKPADCSTRLSLIGNLARADLASAPEAPKPGLLVDGLKRSFPPRLRAYYDRWLEVHDGTEGWPDVKGLLTDEAGSVPKL